jgi:antitoxin HigA-1
MKGDAIMHRIPTKRPPTHPGEMLLQEFLAPLELTQVELAQRIGVPFQRINQIVKQKRSVTPDTALRFAQLLGTTPEFWLNLQQNWDLYEAMTSSAKEISRIKPLKRAG